MLLMFCFYVQAYPTYLNISLTETVNQNTTYNAAFGQGEVRPYCEITGALNITEEQEDVCFSCGQELTQSDPKICLFCTEYME